MVGPVNYYSLDSVSIALTAKLSFEPIEKRIRRRQHFMRPESGSRADKPVSLQVCEYACRLTVVEFKPVLQNQCRSITEVGNYLQDFAA